MSVKKFNGHQDMRIDKVKAHHLYLKPKKDKFDNTKALWNNEQENYDKAPWEITNVKGLCRGKQKPRLDKDKLFDTKNDGLPMKIKKEGKINKLKRAFVMMDGKKYHEVGGQVGF